MERGKPKHLFICNVSHHTGWTNPDGRTRKDNITNSVRTVPNIAVPGITKIVRNVPYRRPTSSQSPAILRKHNTSSSAVLHNTNTASPVILHKPQVTQISGRLTAEHKENNPSGHLPPMIQHQTAPSSFQHTSPPTSLTPTQQSANKSDHPFAILLKSSVLKAEVEMYLPKPISIWEQEDCHSWIQMVCTKHKLDHKIVDDFQILNMNGTELLLWTLKDFARLFGPETGLTIYGELCSKQRELNRLMVEGPGILIQRPKQPSGIQLKDKTLTAQTVNIWELLAVLLASRTHNPNIIQWERKEEGIFKLVKPLGVIGLWTKSVINIPKSLVLPNCNVAAIGLKDKQANILYQLFLNMLCQEINATLIVRIDENNSTIYGLGKEGLDLYRNLKDSTMYQQL